MAAGAVVLLASALAVMSASAPPAGTIVSAAP